jgi:hypothetical protein
MYKIGFAPPHGVGTLGTGQLLTDLAEPLRLTRARPAAN